MCKVSEIAYQRWVATGRPSGQDMENWTWAQDQVREFFGRFCVGARFLLNGQRYEVVGTNPTEGTFEAVRLKDGRNSRRLKYSMDSAGAFDLVGRRADN